MVQAIARSKARLTERQQFWLDHLRVCREQGTHQDPWGHNLDALTEDRVASGQGACESGPGSSLPSPLDPTDFGAPLQDHLASADS